MDEKKAFEENVPRLKLKDNIKKDVKIMGMKINRHVVIEATASEI